MPTTATSPNGDRHERIMVFIDGSNLYHVLGEVCGRHDLNFGKFAEKITGDRRLIRTYYYNIRQDSERDPNIATEQGKFLQTMYDTPYLEVRMGVSKRHGETMVEKGVDVYMATDLVAFAFMDLYDTAIVVSGDGDFFPAIQTARNQGKHIEVAAFDNNLSSEAGNVADVVIKLNKTYFTGLWSDRRRRETSASPARRTRNTSAGSGSTRSASTAPVVEAEAPEESAGSETGNGRRTVRRRIAAPRRSSTRTTTRRRTPTRRAASETADSTPTPAAVPTTENVQEPAQGAHNGSGSGDEVSERSGSPTRQTPTRRRVGTRSSSGNGDSSPPTPPRPPALRRRSDSDSDDGPAN
ncbi:MAG TPA: NYN domain-containing protein [Dehalococcoidia bacterium]|nr:NYN domain-containing protein [Dehalococcoidia bacterium]